MHDQENIERLHILTGAYCNNNCTFCMEDDRDWRAVRNGSIGPDDVRKMLEENVDRGEVIFTSGEPTLNANLLRYLNWAKKLGYRVRGVITNGRRFSDADYAAKAVKAGLNHVVVSIHGADAKLHDSLVRTPGAFVQTIEGIKNLGALRKRTQLTVHTSTVVQERNHREAQLWDLYAVLVGNIDEMILNVIQPWGRGDTHFDRLVPTYSRVISEFQKFLKRYDPSKGTLVYLLDIPYCVTEDLPNEVRGYVERFVHHEVTETSHRVWADTQDPTAGSVGPEIDADQALREKIELGNSYVDEGEYMSLTRDIQNQVTRSKRLECTLCVHNDRCEGVWKNYLIRNGWDEFQPIKAAPLVVSGETG